MKAEWLILKRMTLCNLTDLKLKYFLYIKRQKGFFKYLIEIFSIGIAFFHSFFKLLS